MRQTLHCVVSLITVVSLSTQDISDSYYKDRENLIHGELSNFLGGGIVLSPDEELANKALMHWKQKETDDSFKNPQNFNYSRPYFTYRDDIEQSTVFQIIRRMPKGAVLHVHSSMMLGPEYLVNLTYADNLYACFYGSELRLFFSEVFPQKPCATRWELLSEIRNASTDVERFDKDLENYFSINSDMTADINTVWNEFNRAYVAIKSLILYKPVREQFFYDALKRFYDDNILYVEIRTGLHELYGLEGKTYSKMDLAKMYRDIANQFKEQYPDFVGVKLILTCQRRATFSKVKSVLDLAVKLKTEMPEFFAGFDLVGQEDLGKPLLDLIPVLREYKGVIDFYFHGGETNWFGMSTDENLYDALLLGSKRIGHGYALMKHPNLLTIVRNTSTAIEVNVISNAVLSLVKDVRNHPLSFFLAAGIPVVLSSDDPGVWGADPLSHDFFIAFMGVASRRSDLKTLKQLALNSIKYSAMDEKMKNDATKIFNKKWETFIQELIHDDKLVYSEVSESKVD